MQLLLLLPYNLLARRFGTIHNRFAVVIVVFGVQEEELRTMGGVAIFYMGK
jgi:hypothetical protein